MLYNNCNYTYHGSTSTLTQVYLTISNAFSKSTCQNESIFAWCLMIPLSSFSGVFIGVDPIQDASLGESCDFNDFKPFWEQLGFQSEDREKQASMGFIM